MTSVSPVKTLHYPGAGWDSKFIPYFKKLGYNKFVLYDTLPKFPHYSPGQPGYAKSSSPEIFYQTLRESFGPEISVNGNIRTYENNITYYVNCNANCMTRVPDGDVLLRMFVPHNWTPSMYEGHVTYLDCWTTHDNFSTRDLIESGVNFAIVHIDNCGFPYCDSEGVRWYPPSDNEGQEGSETESDDELHEKFQVNLSEECTDVATIEGATK